MVTASRKTAAFMFSSIFLIALFVGFYSYAVHSNMDFWVKNKLIITRVKTFDKVVALTFDDGPDPGRTDAVLQSLAKHHAKATFFVMGNKAEAHPKLLAKIVGGGHEVGNHSYSHKDFNHMSGDTIRGEIRHTNDIIFKLTAQRPILFRPPGGYLSNELIGICQEEKVVVAYWSWETDSKDWRNGNSSQYISQHICKHIAPGQVIILHDGCANSMETARAVELLLQELSKQGYRFVTMSELIKLEK